MDLESILGKWRQKKLWKFKWNCRAKRNPRFEGEISIDSPSQPSNCSPDRATGSVWHNRRQRLVPAEPSQRHGRCAGSRVSRTAETHVSSFSRQDWVPRVPLALLAAIDQAHASTCWSKKGKEKNQGFVWLLAHFKLNYIFFIIFFVFFWKSFLSFLKFFLSFLKNYYWNLKILT